LRARTQRSGRVLYTCVRTCACGWARDRFLAALSDLGVSLCVRVGRRTSSLNGLLADRLRLRG